MDQSDSLPPSPPIRSGITPTDREVRTGKIETISGALKSLSRPTRIEGEVIRHNRDGSIRIRTEKGEIDIRLKGRDLPAEGARVELQLPAGDPPSRATVRALPPQGETPDPPAKDTRPEQPPPVVSRPSERSTEPRAPSPRLSQELSHNLTERAAAPREIRQLPLKTGDLVRLMPLLPETAERLISQMVPLMQETILPPLPESFPALATPPQNIPAQPITTVPSKIAAPAPLQLAPAFAVTDSPEPANIRIILPQSAHTTTVLPPIAALLPLSLSETGDSPLLSFKPPSGKTPIDVFIQTIVPPAVELVPPDNGGRFEALVAAMDSDKTGITTTAPETTAGTFKGEIVGKTPDNLPIIKIDAIPGPFNFFTMQFPANNLGIGSELTLIPVPVPGTASLSSGSAAQIALATPGAAIPAYSLLPPLFAGFDWPALEELTRTVQQLSPSLAQNLAQAIPSPASPGRLPLAAMIFIAAVQSGDLSSWLGTKVVDTMRRTGHGDLLERLGRDVSGLQRSSSEPVSQDWRALTMPLLWQEEIHQMHLYWRRDKSGDQDNDDKQARTRFIFDLDLTRMGALQLDGLHRGKKLDLIVRTSRPLSQTMQKAMRRQYSNALEVAGIKGELHFQGKKENWVEIDTRQAGGGFQT